jgi:hypothetical protein
VTCEKPGLIRVHPVITDELVKKLCRLQRIRPHMTHVAVRKHLFVKVNHCSKQRVLNDVESVNKKTRKKAFQLADWAAKY